MTAERHYYKHRETGITAEILDRVAAVFGDHLELVDSPNDAAKSTPRTRKKNAAADDTNDDSSEGGNE